MFWYADVGAVELVGVDFEGVVYLDDKGWGDDFSVEVLDVERCVGDEEVVL